MLCTRFLRCCLETFLGLQTDVEENYADDADAAYNGVTPNNAPTPRQKIRRNCTRVRGPPVALHVSRYTCHSRFPFFARQARRTSSSMAESATAKSSNSNGDWGSLIKATCARKEAYVQNLHKHPGQ